uniref:Protein GDAP2 like n=1 Tax=Rhizophora mucronata TaxID=61149 RepID=A0A2P2INH3_RHIMU
MVERVSLWTQEQNMYTIDHRH